MKTKTGHGTIIFATALTAVFAGNVDAQPPNAENPNDESQSLTLR